MDLDRGETEAGGPSQLQIVQRVGSLPVVMSALGQLGALYGYTKESNSFVKYGLETAETGLKKSSEIAMPMVGKFERPVSKLDSFAVSQLERLEQHIPILTKPVPQVKEEATKLYDATLRPTVDRLSSVTKYGVNTVTSVKDKGVSTVNGVRTYTTEKVNGVKTYTAEKVQGVAKYTTDTVHHVADANKKSVQQVADYSGQKVSQLLETRYGQYVQRKVDDVLSGTEAYVDYYLPEQQNQAEGQKVDLPAEAPAPLSPASGTLSKMRHLSRKASTRVYSRGKASLDHIIMRSAEAVSKLNFTVDLMEYAKTHLDNGKSALQDGFVKSKDRVWSVWEQATTQTELHSADDAKNDKKPDLQSRLIATARHLATSLKQSYDALPSTTRFLPHSIRSLAATTQGKIDEIYQSFAGMKTLNDVSTASLNRVRALLGNVQSLSSFLLSYSASYLPALKPAVSGPAVEMDKVPLDANEKSDDKPSADKPSDKPSADKPSADKPSADKPSADKPSADQPSDDNIAPKETKAEPEKPIVPKATKPEPKKSKARK